MSILTAIVILLSIHKISEALILIVEAFTQRQSDEELTKRIRRLLDEKPSETISNSPSKADGEDAKNSAAATTSDKYSDS